MIKTTCFPSISYIYFLFCLKNKQHFSVKKTTKIDTKKPVKTVFENLETVLFEFENIKWTFFLETD